MFFHINIIIKLNNTIIKYQNLIHFAKMNRRASIIIGFARKSWKGIFLSNDLFSSSKNPIKPIILYSLFYSTPRSLILLHNFPSSSSTDSNPIKNRFPLQHKGYSTYSLSIIISREGKISNYIPIFSSWWLKANKSRSTSSEMIIFGHL